MSKTVFRDKTKLVAALSCLLFLGITPKAAAQRIEPQCPTDCYKRVHIYNNTDGPIWFVIQAGFQNPDPWLQALLNTPIAETHYSRVYINLNNGIRPGESVTVELPWYSKLVDDPAQDQYADWWNGGRFVIFDNKDVVTAAYNADKANGQLSTDPSLLVLRCITSNCEQPVPTLLSSKSAFELPAQLLEYTFADVGTSVSPPYVIDLNVGYNVSYLDQIYLPVALAPCLTEPCVTDGSDLSAAGYLGSTASFTQFRGKLKNFMSNAGWPRYNSALDSASLPRLPGAYNLITDALGHAINSNAKSNFTPNSWDSTALKTLTSQWTNCNTTGKDCPQSDFYQYITRFFTDNFNKYRMLPGYTGKDFPTPANLDNADKQGSVGQLYLMQFVYGWAAFNRGCTNLGAGINSLNPNAPNFNAPFSKAINEYVQLLYNYQTEPKLQQQFNPFTDLVHGDTYLHSNSYAFSVDDAAGFQNNPGQGLVIAVGGPKGLPNNTPAQPPANFNTDFEINLGDTAALKRPDWAKYRICSDTADTSFPPFPANTTNRSRTIIVRIATKTMPCTVTVEDAQGQRYQIQVAQKVPWNARSGGGFDSSVVTCPIIGTSTWCQTETNELSIPDAPRFALVTGPSCANKDCQPN